MKHEKVVSRLRDAVATQEQVVILSRVDPDFRLDGFVVQVGEKWAMIARTRDGGHFNGHSLVRIRSVATVYPARSFESTFARTLKDWPPKPLENTGAVDLDTTRRMLHTSIPAGALVGVESKHRPGAVNIGRMVAIGPRRITLQEIDPAGKWIDKVRKWRIGRLVALTIGDDYQRALASVAGPAPEVNAES